MKKLTFKDIKELKDVDILTMTGIIEFSGAVTMAEFVKKLNPLHKAYEADYANFTIKFD